jgi:hypothetical protein
MIIRAKLDPAIFISAFGALNFLNSMVSKNTSATMGDLEPRCTDARN